MSRTNSFLTLGNNRTPFPDDWPFMGTVVGAKRSASRVTPECRHASTQTQRSALHARPANSPRDSAWNTIRCILHGSHDEPLKFQSPALVLEGDITVDRLTRRYSLLRDMDTARYQFDRRAETRTWERQQDRALSLLMSSRTAGAFDVSSEPTAIRERYGQTLNGMSFCCWRGDWSKPRCRSSPCFGERMPTR